MKLQDISIIICLIIFGILAFFIEIPKSNEAVLSGIIGVLAALARSSGNHKPFTKYKNDNEKIDD